jgi:hypothetical protein
MAEPQRVTEVPPHDPRDPHEAALARKNNVLGLWLFAIALMILGATIAVAFIYLAAD